MNKKLPAVCLAIIALVLTAFPMRTFAAGDAVAASPNMIDLGEVKVTAIPVTPTEFMTNASGDTVMKYNASLSVIVSLSNALVCISFISACVSHCLLRSA